MVNSAQQARDAVAAMRFRPLGNRSMGSSARATVYGSDYQETANDEILCVVQIEHAVAVRDIDDIVAVPGVDACFIGPVDLGSSMGLKPGQQAQHPEFEAAIQCVLAAARHAGKPAGIHVQTSEDANKRLKEGFQFIALATDKALLTNEAKRQLAAVAR